MENKRKKVIYTCLVGSYDDLRQPKAVRGDWDYVCFSNDIAETRIGVWEIRRIPYENDNATRLSRYPKLLPHKVLGDYRYSLYLDANITIESEDFYEICDRLIAGGTLIAQVPHLWRDCIYDEIRECAKLGKDRFKTLREQCRFLQSEGFPHHFGLYENNMLLRAHRDDAVVAISELWWKTFLEHANRDQLSLCYVYWKLGFKPELLFGEQVNTRNSRYVKYYLHPPVELSVGARVAFHLRKMAAAVIF
ncbi:MAG: DUF616 domain-containing protein [Alistipes sp.]|nr:DUF616 domain-containing protein [Alistipes sp.]